MEVEHACGSTGAAEAVPCARRRREQRSRPGANRVVADRELDLALEHVEGVDVVGVRVRVDREGVVELDLDDRQAGQVDPDHERAVVALETLAVAGPADDRVHRGIV